MSVTWTADSQAHRRQSAPARRVLLIAYSFPPVGGAGVQRPAKWVKYLPQLGWDVTVLTPENPSVPVRDESLLDQIPCETRILRAPTWEPGYHWKQRLAGKPDLAAPGIWRRCKSGLTSFVKWAAQTALQPDPQVLWVRNAVRLASEELRRIKHDAIVVTVPPYSMLMIGAALKRRFDVPLVFDFRDEWDLSSRYLEQANRGWWSQWIQRRMQRSLLAQADAVLTTTQASAQAYQGKLAEVDNPARACCLYNGFDPDDFAAESPDDSRQKSDRFRLVYTGTLWNLTDVEPLVNAVERLQACSPELLSRLELVCVGRKTQEQQRVLERLRHTSCRTVFHDYCDHRDVSHWLSSADALCLLLSDVPGAERVVPAKLFEYLAARKNLLAIVPHGETARLVRRFQPNGHFVPRDVEGIVHWLADALSQQTRPGWVRGSRESLEEFSRPHLTGQLADLLNQLTGHSGQHETLDEQANSQHAQPCPAGA